MMTPLAAAHSAQTLTAWATVALVVGTFALAAVSAWTLRRLRRQREQDLAPVVVVEAGEACGPAGQEFYVALSNAGAAATRLDLEVCFQPRDVAPSAPRSVLLGAPLAGGGALWFAAPQSGYAERPMSFLEARAVFVRITVTGAATDQAGRRYAVHHELPLDTTSCRRIAEPPTQVVPSPM